MKAWTNKSMEPIESFNGEVENASGHTQRGGGRNGTSNPAKEALEWLLKRYCLRLDLNRMNYYTMCNQTKRERIWTLDENAQWILKQNLLIDVKFDNFDKINGNDLFSFFEFYEGYKISVESPISLKKGRMGLTFEQLQQIQQLLEIYKPRPAIVEASEAAPSVAAGGASGVKSKQKQKKPKALNSRLDKLRRGKRSSRGRR